jgi:hypothetical protein
MKHLGFLMDTYSNNFWRNYRRYFRLFKHKQIQNNRTLGGFDGNGSGLIGLLPSGLWMSTAALLHCISLAYQAILRPILIIRPLRNKGIKWHPHTHR